MTDAAATLCGVKKTGKENGCAWCGEKISGNPRRYGLITRFRKKIELEEEEEKRISISIVHLEKTVPAYVCKSSQHSEPALDLTFQTCSQRCAEVLRATLHFEKRLFSAPMTG